VEIENISSILETTYLISIPEIKEILDEAVELEIEECGDFEW
jgi:hypothetical protein